MPNDLDNSHCPWRSPNLHQHNQMAFNQGTFKTRFRNRFIWHKMGQRWYGQILSKMYSNEFYQPLWTWESDWRLILNYNLYYRIIKQPLWNKTNKHVWMQQLKVWSNPIAMQIHAKNLGTIYKHKPTEIITCMFTRTFNLFLCLFHCLLSMSRKLMA